MALVEYLSRFALLFAVMLASSNLPTKAHDLLDGQLWFRQTNLLAPRVVAVLRKFKFKVTPGPILAAIDNHQPGASLMRP